jgi:hypothetical protein
LEKKMLEKLLRKGEGCRIEFKRQLNIDNEAAKAEFIKDLTAMANTSSGDGYIIYGITDEAEIMGIQKRKGLEESLSQIAASRCLPPPEFSTEWVDKNGKNILVLQVPESQLRPHATLKRDVYIRRGKIIDKAYPTEILQMMMPARTKITSSDSAISQDEEPQGSEHSDFLSKYDLHFFPINGPPQAYRVCQTHERYAEPAVCPVFMPHYGIFVPEPEFGETKSVISFDFDSGRSPHLKRETFCMFLDLLEKRLASLSEKAGIWEQLPLSWSYSADKQMMYGMGADNAKLAFNASPNRVFFGGIIQFARINVYKSTNFVVLAADIYKEGERTYLRDFGMKLMLSTLPLSNGWINDLFDVVEIMGYKTPSPKIGDNALSEPLRTLDWNPKIKARMTRLQVIKPIVLGLMGRDDPTYGLEDAMGLGVVIDADVFKKIEFEIDKDDSSNWEWYSQIFNTPPCAGFSELPVQITNPVPTFTDINNAEFAISVPTFRQVTIGLSGLVVIAINAHSFLSRR